MKKNKINTAQKTWEHTDKKRRPESQNSCFKEICFFIKFSKVSFLNKD